jgi:hypothetical protein
LDVVLEALKEDPDPSNPHLVRRKEILSCLDLDFHTQKDLDSYRSILDCFSDEKEPFLKPFNWYKKIYSDGREEINTNNIEGFLSVSSDKYIIFDPEKDIKPQLEIINNWIRVLEIAGREGVIVKPEFLNLEKAPALKVRNKSYLQLIYGIDFHRNYSRYFKKRSIKDKLKNSISDHKAWFKLLNFPYTSDSEDFKKAFLDKILASENFHTYKAL